MEIPMWRSCAGYIERIGDILSSGKGLMVGPMMSKEEELTNDMMMCFTGLKIIREGK